MALGPVQAFTGRDTKARWTDLYSSDTINKAFIGMPKGVYLGFAPVITGQTLTLKTDTAVTFKDLIGSFNVGDTLTGNASAATAVIRVVRTDLPGRGFLLVDSVTGVFNEGETIVAGGAVAELEAVTTEDVSVAKVATTSEFGGDRTEESITVVLGAEVDLDFSPATIIDGTYYVQITVDYAVGRETTAQVTSIKDEPPDHRLSVGVCAVTKFGATLTLEPVSNSNRTDPFADNTTRAGFMPASSIADLANALSTVQEVVAAHISYDGTDHGTFDPGAPETTGLPGRLNFDLERANMANRLGKELLVVAGNDITLQAVPSANTINISGSFSAKIRDRSPFRDVSNGPFPTGLNVPTVIMPDGFSGITLTVSAVTGAFAVGDKISGATSGGVALVHAVNGNDIDISDQGRSLFVGEQITSSGASATIDSVNTREGAVTAPESGIGGDPVHNLVTILDTLTGKRPISSAGKPIYGRLLFGPSGSSGSGGGDPGELLVAENAGEQLNFTNGSTAITGNNIDFTEFFLPGDLVEGDDGRFYEIDPTSGSVQTGTIFLTSGKPYIGPSASSGLGVGSGPRRRMRYTLKFVSVSNGIESDEVISSSSIPTGAQLRIFFPVWFLRGQSNYNASLELRATGDSHRVVAPGSSQPGISYAAAIGPSTQIIGAIKSVRVGGVDPGAGNYHTINYQTGTLSSPSDGVIDIYARGPTGPPGGSGVGSPGPQGPQGSGFTNIFILPVKIIDSRGLPFGTSTDTFDFSPKRIRFYTITSYWDRDYDGSSGAVSRHGIVGVVTPNYDVDSVLTFTYAHTNYAGNIRVFCAAATN